MKKFTSEISAKKQDYGDIIVTVHDKYGNLLQRVEQIVDSFVDQYWILNQRNFSGVGSIPLTDLLNNGEALSAPSIMAYSVDSLINSFAGIVVGTGSSATTISKKILDTLVTHGQENNQLEAQVSTAEWDATTQIATLTRPFVNLSANQATLTIAEVAIALGATGSASTATNSYMVVRDVLQSSVNVPYEATLAVQYKVRMFSGNNNYKNVFIRPFGISTTSNAQEISGITNITGSLITVQQGAFARLFSTEGMTNRGLIFGTSNNAFNVTQINLGSRINHGNSAGELFYHSTTNSNIFINTTSNSLYYQFFRSVENRSGSNISINEVGIFTDFQEGGVQSFMLDRRVVDPPVTVTNGDTVTFMWEFCYEV
jgi:hypothetical protein